MITTGEQARALEIARQLIRAGVPVFAAEPDPHSPLGYRLPKHWEKTYPSEVNLDRWRPGWALAAVGGSTADFLDVDPRNGGDASVQELKAAGHWPRSFGQQSTPSGGTHYVITPTGERKGVPLAGLDLQAGDAHGVGRGFVWISPTVRRSKTTGELVAYRWEVGPDLEGLEEWRGQDESTAGIVTRLQAKRSASVPAQRVEADTADPFLTASSASQGGERAFTQAQAQDFVRPALLALQAARIGEIEEKANTAAVMLSRFVPTFWRADEAFRFLTDALSHTAYDPDHQAATWRAEKFLPVLDGRRPLQDPWKAVRRAEQAPGGQEKARPDRVAALLGKMLDPDALECRPHPRPLVRGLVNLESLTWIIGEPGSFKSFVALDLAAHVGAGLPWRGQEVTRGRVLYVAAEGASGMTLRMRAWRKVYGATPDLLTLPEPVQASDPQAWAALVEACRELGPVLVVIDTQARNTVGMEENDNTAMGVFIERLEELKRATGACVLVVHHTGRNGGDARGASAIDGAQDTELKVIRAKPRSALAAKVSVEKQKDGEDGWHLPITLQKVNLGTDPETGEELGTLTLEPFDAFNLAQGVEEAPDWQANLTENQRDVMAAMLEHSDETGATRAQAIQWVKAHREHRNQPAMTPTSFDSATKALKAKGLLLKEGTRWIAAEYAEAHE
ncbi:AAA family ATPase [Micromonospora rubida]|uniref:AAA family ATPase n=1 Tax=Micromonospora rubida TaxID=2697657 RepID=UPI001378E76F|nr:AAA family ATPase [Micromonospora rubida]NBE84584.1 AAA family ATPase [Micromonospora rubida]